MVCIQPVHVHIHTYKLLTFANAAVDRDFFFSLLFSGAAAFLTTPPALGRSGSEQELAFEDELLKKEKQLPPHVNCCKSYLLFEGGGLCLVSLMVLLSAVYRGASDKEHSTK